jgi:thiamine-phosphate pyrophosphorylase
MTLDPFYLVVDDVAWIERLVPLGVRLVQLRVKDCIERDLRRQIRSARDICARHACRLVINDHWRLAIEEGCDTLHLGQEDLAEANLAAIRAAGLRLGLSTHDEAELRTALNVAPDYVALGPVYPTTLKAMRWAPQGLERITEWKRQVEPVPLVAIGGLTVERLPGVFASGADCAAVVGDVLKHPDPEAQTLAWILATEPWRKCAARSPN